MDDGPPKNCTCEFPRIQLKPTFKAPFKTEPASSQQFYQHAPGGGRADGAKLGWITCLCHHASDIPDDDRANPFHPLEPCHSAHKSRPVTCTASPTADGNASIPTCDPAAVSRR